MDIEQPIFFQITLLTLILNLTKLIIFIMFFMIKTRLKPKILKIFLIFLSKMKIRKIAFLILKMKIEKAARSKPSDNIFLRGIDLVCSYDCTFIKPEWPILGKIFPNIIFSHRTR